MDWICLLLRWLIAIACQNSRRTEEVQNIYNTIFLDYVKKFSALTCSFVNVMLTASYIYVHPVNAFESIFAISYAKTRTSKGKESSARSCKSFG